MSCGELRARSGSDPGPVRAHAGGAPVWARTRYEGTGAMIAYRCAIVTVSGFCNAAQCVGKLKLEPVGPSTWGQRAVTTFWRV